MNVILHRLLSSMLIMLAGITASSSAQTAPTVITGAASNISQYGATLNGTVNANGNSGLAVFFDYGSTTSYGSSVSAGTVSGSATTPVSATASVGNFPNGYGPGLNWLYRIRVQNGGLTYHR